MAERPKPILNGRYELLSLLGEGGMARVMLGRDLELGREVAIKVMSGDLLGHVRARQRFDREAIFQARLDHPNVVRIYDHHLEGPEPYLAMEYVVGRDLDRTIREEGPLPLPRLERLAREIGGAVDAMHDVGLIHRDLKPANVMMRDLDGSAVVMDLGLVHTEDMASLTDTGDIIGSPRYMPQEVLRQGIWSPEGDRWAVGAILFEAATGIFLVQGRNLQQLLENAAGARYTPFPEQIELPPHVVAAIRRAVDPDPDRRFGRALDFAEALVDPGLGLADPEQEVSPLTMSRGARRTAPNRAQGGMASPSYLTGPSDEPSSGPAEVPAMGKDEAYHAPESRDATAPGPVWLCVGAGLLALMAFGLGLMGWTENSPTDIRWTVVGNAVLVRCDPRGATGLRLVLGDREVGPVTGENLEEPARPDGSVRLILRDLPDGENLPRLRWDGGESPAVPLRSDSPAIREAARLGPAGTLLLTVTRSCRARLDDGEPISLEAGPVRLPWPTNRTRVLLRWEEQGVSFRRSLTRADLGPAP